MANDRQHGVGKVHATENLSADHGMHLGLLEFGRCERARLVQNVIGHRQLAYIVQIRSGVERLDFHFGKFQQLAETGGIGLHAPNVEVGRLIFCVDCGGQRFDRRQM